MDQSQSWLDGWRHGWTTEGITGTMVWHLAIGLAVTALLVTAIFQWYRIRKSRRDAMFPGPPPNDGENRQELP